MDSSIFQLLAEVEQGHWWFVARRRIMRRILQELLPPDGKSLVVDVGCGTGANIASLEGDYECAGIDTSEDAIRYARQRFEHVQYILGHAPQELGELADRMDAFLMMDVLEHVENDRELLGHQLAALRPGGYALLTVPADMRLWSEHDVTHGHYRRYDVKSFRSLWDDFPVEELLLSHFNTRLYPVVRAVRILNRLRGRAWGQAGTDLSVPWGPVNRCLEGIFAGEMKRLIRLLRGRRSRGYTFGVSLMAILKKSKTRVKWQSELTKYSSETTVRCR